MRDWIREKLGGRRTPGDYGRRLECEIANFADQVDVHALPEIFHYWSNRYLRPILESFGFSSPDDFFLQYLRRIVFGRPDARILSLGAGNGDLEIWLVHQLLEDGFSDFRLVVTDINEAMLERGRANAERQGVAHLLDFERADFNDWRPHNPVDVIIANQSLHHVQNLEGLFRAIRKAIAPVNGWLLTSDMIGRNGHMRWPEALSEVERFWKQLPERYRYNQQLKRYEPQYINHDCSTRSFEGIRAQDILPLLLATLHFELFIGFGNIIDVFIDRGFGHNFDPASAADREFIDRVHETDARLMQQGLIKPTHMIAALRPQPVHVTRYWEGLSPQLCIRRPGDGWDVGRRSYEGQNQ